MTQNKRLRVHYSDYVKHMTYEYLTLPEEQQSEITRQNSEAVRNVVKGLSDIERDIVTKVYLYRFTMEGVEAVSRETGMLIETVYSVLRAYEKLVAKERGLI